MRRDKAFLYKSFKYDTRTIRPVIFPDGEISSIYFDEMKLGHKWYSFYWGGDVEVAEISEDRKMCWAEEVKK